MSELPAGILALGRDRRYLKGSFLFQAEEKAESFFYLRSGEVRVFKLDENGRELEVARLAPGDFAGEAFALTGGRFPFFAQAARDARVLAFSAAEVERALAADAGTARFFIRLLAGKCVRLSKRVESLGLKTVRRRLAEFLLSRCGGKNGCSIVLPMSKGELARALGTVSETLSRTLRQLRDEGVIDVKGKSILIRDCPGLKADSRPD